MSDIVKKIKTIEGLSSGRGCSDEQLKEAQELLDIVFPEEFVDYVKAFGCIDFGATEWTGLNIKGYLNTVIATQSEKEINPDFPSNYFVLEDMNIDGRKVVVNEDGKVFLLQYEKMQLLCNSISEYLVQCIERNK